MYTKHVSLHEKLDDMKCTTTSCVVSSCRYLALTVSQHETIYTSKLRIWPQDPVLCFAEANLKSIERKHHKPATKFCLPCTCKDIISSK